MTEGTLVLLYHRVAHLDRDPYEFAVHPDRFEQQCDLLRRRCEIVPLLAATGASQQVAITFDDGYADNNRDACSILASAGLPATFFITAGRIGERREVWWDRLEQIALGHEPSVGHLEIDIGGRGLRLDLRSKPARARAHLALYWRLRRLRPAAIELILSQLEEQLGVKALDRETHRWMNVEELRALSSKTGVDLGAHTLTHPMLASLSVEEQRTEIDESRKQLERLLEMPVTMFSYPFGGHDAFDGVTTRLVREAGYSLACTGTGGLAGPDQFPFLVPRNVVGDWDASTFERWLDRWIGAS